MKKVFVFMFIIMLMAFASLCFGDASPPGSQPIEELELTQANELLNPQQLESFASNYISISWDEVMTTENFYILVCQVEKITPENTMVYCELVDKTIYNDMVQSTNSLDNRNNFNFDFG